MWCWIEIHIPGRVTPVLKGRASVLDEPKVFALLGSFYYSATIPNKNETLAIIETILGYMPDVGLPNKDGWAFLLDDGPQFLKLFGGYNRIGDIHKLHAEPVELYDLGEDFIPSTGDGIADLLSTVARLPQAEWLLNTIDRPTLHKAMWRMAIMAIADEPKRKQLYGEIIATPEENRIQELLLDDAIVNFDKILADLKSNAKAKPR